MTVAALKLRRSKGSKAALPFSSHQLKPRQRQTPTWSLRTTSPGYLHLVMTTSCTNEGFVTISHILKVPMTHYMLSCPFCRRCSRISRCLKCTCANMLEVQNLFQLVQQASGPSLRSALRSKSYSQMSSTFRTLSSSSPTPFDTCTPSRTSTSKGARFTMKRGSLTCLHRSLRRRIY